MIKAYTDIEQSKRLSEILPVESADMWFHPYPNDEYWYDIPNFGNANLKYNQLPCWSLAALLSILLKETVLQKSAIDDRYHCVCPNANIFKWVDNPIDTCYGIILKLKEKDLL